MNIKNLCPVLSIKAWCTYFHQVFNLLCTFMSFQNSMINFCPWFNLFDDKVGWYVGKKTYIGMSMSLQYSSDKKSEALDTNTDQ